MPPATCRNLRPPSTIQRRRTCDPWDADYPTSLETQRRIKLAALSALLSLDNDKDEYDVACRNENNVLSALLDADPWECNAIIVVCALTLSSKMLVRREKRHPHFSCRTVHHLDLFVIYLFFNKKERCFHILCFHPTRELTILDQ
jgi:hypothetical protein